MKKKVNKKKENIKNIILIIIILMLIALITILGIGYYKKTTYKVENPIATLEIQDYGTIKIELYPDQAENTVRNFITLSNNGFYDGLTFHRIIKDFMIQGGDIKGDGTGSPTLSYIDKSIEKGSDNDKEYNINGEFIENGYEQNTLKLEKGVIAMARNDYSSYQYYDPSLLEEGYNTAGSQFFIMTTDDNVALTGSYAGFGKVIEGFDVVEKIANVKVKKANDEDTEASTPEKAPVITSIRVETYGNDYKVPETHDQFDINSHLSSMFSSTVDQ